MKTTTLILAAALSAAALSTAGGLALADSHETDAMAGMDHSGMAMGDGAMVTMMNGMTMPAMAPMTDEAMRPFIDLKPTNVVLAATVVAEFDGIAILYDDWSGTGHGPDGSSVPLAGKAVEIVRCQSDGTWKFIFDDPNARG